MPQVDLESFVCGGCGDPKVACETTLTESKPDKDPDPELPAESYVISITDSTALDWLDINPVYDRDDSTKGTTNPKSHNHNGTTNQKPGHSQRFSGNLKAPIIGLPNKVQHSGYLGLSTRRAHGARIFVQRGVRVSDPGSPKVSCFGKVLSERERRNGDGGGGGCFSAAIISRWLGRRKQEKGHVAGEGKLESRRNIPARETKAAATAAAAAAPGLGGMKRFVSGRRSASWGGDEELDLGGEEEGGHVAWSGPLDLRR